MVKLHTEEITTSHILGTYRRTREVHHFVNTETRLWAMYNKGTGEFISGWILSGPQVDFLLITKDVS